MNEAPPKAGFWHTVPGMLTAVAAVITALAGLLAILLQLGVVGGGDPAVVEATPSSVTLSSGGTSPGQAAATSTGKPWSQVEAVWTPKEGAQIRMPARTMGFCINGGGGVFLDKRQNVSFESMKSIDILRSDVALSAGGTADVRIVLTSGATLTGTVDAGCDFIGNPETGRVDLYPDRMRRIEFIR